MPIEKINSLCKKTPKYFISTSSIHRITLIFDSVIPIIILNPDLSFEKTCQVFACPYSME